MLRVESFCTRLFGSYRRPRKPLRFRHDLGLFGVFEVVGRHDLHAVFVECVLDGGVEIAGDAGAGGGPVGADVDDQFVGDVEIRQRGLNDVGFRLRADFGDGFRRFEQHGVYLPPRYVVANGDSGVEHEAGARCNAREVARHVGEHYRIG